MKRIFGILILSILLSPVSGLSVAAECKPDTLSKKALELVRNYIVAASSFRKAELEHQENIMGKLNASETTLEIILNDKTRDGDQAVAYFLNLYTGEHSGGELLCNAINRGKRMLPLIESYTRCLPITGLEPLSDDLDGSGFLPRHAKKAIENGERCTDHQ